MLLWVSATLSHTILSCCGVQQGDFLGLLAFALTLHIIIDDEVLGLVGVHKLATRQVSNS